MATPKFETVMECIQDIRKVRTQTAANARDELRVAQAMLNDRDFVVDVYGKSGVVGQYCPYLEMRTMLANAIREVTHMSQKESTELAMGYTYDRNAAQSMVNFSKQYVLTYTETGRKLPLGCREHSNISLLQKHKEAKISSFPMPTSVDADGNKVYASKTSITPEYDTMRVIGTCPAHLKNR